MADPHSLYNSIAFFSGGLLITLTLLIALFIYLFPRDTIFWKRSDYIYFGFAILAALIGIIDFYARDSKGKIHELGIERTQLLARLYNNLSYALQSCQKSLAETALTNDLEKDRSEGVLRNLPTDEWTLFDPKSLQEIPIYSNDECKTITDLQLWLQTGREPDDSPYELWDAEDLKENKKSPDIFSIQDHSESIILAELIGNKDQRMHSDFGQWIERIIYNNNQITSLATDLNMLNWMPNIRFVWPFLLGFGLAVRLARIHAEVRMEILKKSLPM
jgi:hypothetical protein